MSKEMFPMRFPMRILYVSLFVLVAGPSALAQVNLDHVSVRAGVIADPWSPTSGHQWRFYPEVELGGKFILPYFNWGLSWGYWSQGITQILPIKDNPTYSQEAHILAARVAFNPQALDNHFPIPIDLFGGVAVHLSRTTYIGGTDMSGNRGESSTSQSTTGIIGVRLTFSVISPFSLDGEVMQFIPFANPGNMQKGRRELKLGIMATI
jgi:hypothetical protein